MDALPPNDPDRNARHNPSKGGNDGSRNADRAAVEVFGDIQDSPLVVAMFFVGVVTWFLRERCIC